MGKAQPERKSRIKFLEFLSTERRTYGDIPRKILERRKKLEQERLKEESKLKALKEKLRATEAEILQTEKQEEIERQVIIGKIFSERMKKDEALKNWFDETIEHHFIRDQERVLFGLSLSKA
jgi:hypothetical protein